MSRYFTLRMLGIFVSGLLAVVACLFLARWQWDRAHVESSDSVSTKTGSIDELNPLRQFMPVESIGATTTVTGTWVPNSRIVLGKRIANGPMMIDAAQSSSGQDVIVDWAVPQCSWVSDALRLHDGSVIQVVRGCLDPSRSAAPISGTAEITGVLQPPEDSDVVKLPHVNGLLTTDRVVAATKMTAHDGYLVSSSAGSGLEKVVPLLASTPHVPLHWRNVFYVFNWLFFAAIVIAMWGRVVRDELRDGDMANVEAD